MEIPHIITPDLQITSCKLISKLRFRVEFLAHNRIKGEALYGWGNCQYTTLAVNSSITDGDSKSDMETIDELIKDNRTAIGDFLREEEKLYESMQS